MSESDWCSLGAPPHELQLDFSLPTGQSFRWRQTGPSTYTGVIGDRLVVLRQTPSDVEYRVLARGRGAAPDSDSCPGSDSDSSALRDYFNLATRLADLVPGWAARCERFRAVSPHFPGARMLRQDPLECLFQFICSSNNHISRIHGMVERLCSAYGTPLAPTASSAAAAGPGAPGGADAPPGAGSGAAAGTAGKGASAVGSGAGATGGLAFYAFPTLEQLSAATEEELRAAGFGYRARFIVGTTAALRAKPGGGREWLLGLRRVGLEEAVAALTELPGIGPKVAACICLFSLDKHAAIPVDTHVWQLAVRHYAPQLRGRSLTKKLHAEVQALFVERFGPYAGWAHNTLFISELASQQHRLPEGLRVARAGAAAAGRRRRGAQAEGEGEEEGEGANAGADADSGPPSDEDGGDGTSGGGGDAPKSAAGKAHARKRAQPGPGAAAVRGRRSGRIRAGGGGADAGAGGEAAVPDGQADLGEPSRRSTTGHAAAPAAERPKGRCRKKGRGPRGPSAASYGLDEFDDLAA